MLTSRAHPQNMGPRYGGHRHHGHAHVWERAVSRGQFVRAAAGVTGAALSSGLWMPAAARADDLGRVPPKPIPETTNTGIPGAPPIHFILPGRGTEPSSITDFDGFIGVAHLQGTGTAIDTSTGATTRLLFDLDDRFMKGIYVGVDGQQHRGTFVEI